jgi:RNA-directed DNA polymerase
MRQGKARIKIYPSKEKQLSIIKKIGDLCRKYRSISSYDLISFLRPIILGWANYYRFTECKEVFNKLDFKTFGILRAWVFRRDKRNGRNEVKERYFPSGNVYKYDGCEYKDNWILVGKKKDEKGIVKTNYLIKFSWVKSAKHVLVADTNSIYDKSLSAYWCKL